MTQGIQRQLENITLNVNQDIYDLVRARLSENADDPKSIEILALVIAEIHQQTDQPIDDIISSISGNTQASDTVIRVISTAVNILNSLRPPTSQVGFKL